MYEDERGAAAAGVGTAGSERIEGVVVGRLVRAGETTEVLVDFPGNPTDGPLAARSTVISTAEDVGREVALAFERGDPESPLVLGFMYHPGAYGGAAADPVAVSHLPEDVDDGADEADSTDADPEVEAAAQQELEARMDGERLVLSADREIVLRCGRASITLTRAGKVLVRGAYLLSRSSGVNRIKGGSVQIN